MNGSPRAIVVAEGVFVSARELDHPTGVAPPDDQIQVDFDLVGSLAPQPGSVAITAIDLRERTGMG